MKLSLNRVVSHAKRLTQQNWELRENASVSQEASEFNNPAEPASSEVSGRTFSCVVNRNHVSRALNVSRANFLCRNVANSLSRDVFESPGF